MKAEPEHVANAVNRINQREIVEFNVVVPSLLSSFEIRAWKRKKKTKPKRFPTNNNTPETTPSVAG